MVVPFVFQTLDRLKSEWKKQESLRQINSDTKSYEFQIEVRETHNIFGCNQSIRSRRFGH
jgi:hypothetical protein